MFLRGMEGIEMATVGAQLLNSSSAEGVTSSNENTKAILNQPETDLKKRGEQLYLSYYIKCVIRHSKR